MKRISLALSGGGVRTVAHIGAIKALEEAGYEISELSGTSGGGLVAILYAYGYSVKELQEISYGITWFHVLRMNHFIRNLLKGRKLRIPITIIYSTIDGLEMRSSATPETIKRSCHIVGLPALEGRFLDGSLVNNFPVNVLSTKYERLGLNAIQKQRDPLIHNYFVQQSQIQDIYMLQQKKLTELQYKIPILDINNTYTNPLDTSKENKRLLIERAYEITKNYLSH